MSLTKGRGGFAAVLNLLFPPKCPFCQRVLDEPEECVCPVCQPTLPWLTGTGVQSSVDFAQICLSPLAYQGRVPEAIHRYKFTATPAYAAPFGVLLAQCYQSYVHTPADVITWVPLSPKRRRRRGFDQAQLLAAELGARLQVAVQPTLQKIRHTQPQSGLDQPAQRRANALGAYALRPEAQVAGKRVVLVDDVVTSGATLGECARLLSQAGGQVICLTLAKAGTGPHPPAPPEASLF